MSKYQVLALAVLLLATLAFAENEGSANRRRLQTTCLSNQVLLGDGTTCLRCGASGTFTRNKKNATACNCNPSSLIWTNTGGQCDCGDKAALLVSSAGRPTCVTCDQKVNSIGKGDNITCLCIGELVWNATLRRCDCEDPATYADGQCITCDSTKNAKGVNSKIPGQCECISSNMKWNATNLKCVCANPNAVIFTVDEVVSCKVCGSTINSLSSRGSDTQCDCPDELIWTENVGCGCPEEGQVLIPGAKPTCVVCDETIFSSGPSEDGKSCICVSDALKWNSRAGKCLCPKTSQVPVGDPIICFECKNRTAQTSLPVIGGVNCSCTNKKLTWDAESQTCACPDPATQVFIFSPSARCVTCNESINATGIDDASPGKCACEQPMTFIDGRCSCGKTSAYVGETGAFVCVNCINATAYLRSKKNESECNCASTALKWNTTLGICNCPDNKVPYGKAPGVKCAVCKGANIVTDTLNETDPNICQCPTTQFAFSITTAGVPSCNCIEKNSIVTLAQECLVCPSVIAEGGLGVVLAAHECKCTNTFIWKWADNTCAKCSADDNAKPSGGNGVACLCKDTFIWDVATQSCIEPCTANDASCLDCASITNSNGGSAVLTSSQTIKTRIAVAGASSIKALLTNSAVPTNFNKLSIYQCVCAEKFLWDPVHFKCVSETLN